MKKTLSIITITLLMISILSFGVQGTATFNYAEDFSGPLTTWSVSSPAVGSSISVSDGILKFDKIEYGSYAGPTEQFTDFALQFELSNCTAGWPIIAFQTQGDNLYGAGGYNLSLLNNGAAFASAPGDVVVNVAASGRGFATGGWKALNDNANDVLIGGDARVITFKIIVKNDIMKLYMKNSLDSLEVQNDLFSKSVGEWPIISAIGGIRFASGLPTTFNLDNIKLSSDSDADLSSILVTEPTPEITPTPSEINYAEDFSGPLTTWSVSSPAVGSSISVSDGMLKFDKIEYGSYAGPTEQFTDFALQFELSNCTAGWPIIAFQTQGDNLYGAGGYNLSLLNNGAAFASAPGDVVVNVAASGRGFATGGWKALNDNANDVLIGGDARVITFKIIVKNDIMKLYMKNSLDSLEVQNDLFSKSVGEWPIISAIGGIRFASGLPTTFNLDNIKLSSDPDADLSAILVTEPTPEITITPEPTSIPEPTSTPEPTAAPVIDEINYTEDFSGSLTAWFVASPPEGSSISVSDGMLKFDKIEYGSYAGPTAQFNDFVLQFEISDCTLGWPAVSFQTQGEELYGEGGYLLMLLNNGAALVKEPGDVTTYVSGSELYNSEIGKWKVLNDNINDYLFDEAPKVITYKIIVKNNLMKLYMKNSLDSLEIQNERFSKSLGEWPIVSAIGGIRFTTGLPSTFNLDNLKLSSNPDEFEIAPTPTGITEPSIVPTETNQSTLAPTEALNSSPNTGDVGSIYIILIIALAATTLLFTKKIIKAS